MSRRVLLAVLVSASFVVPCTAGAAVVGWGYNTSGQLGAGFKSNSQTATTAKVPSSCAVKEIASGVAWTLALCQDGRVFAWGGNQIGQLGIGKPSVGSLVPVQVPITGATQVAAGGSHSVALLSDGTVRVWGSNLFGEAGDGTSTHGKEMKGDNLPSPRLVPGLSGVCAVAAGGPDDLAVLCDGTVKGWGENKSGQLGAPATFEVTTPKTIPGLSGVVKAAVGAFPASGGHVVALRSDGTALAIGRNDQGQLGDGSTVQRESAVPVKGVSGLVAVSASIDATSYLRGDGTAFTSGSNLYGELGVGSGPEGCTIGKKPPVTVPCSRTPTPLSLHNVTAISSGFRFVVVIAGGGLPFASGWNLRESLGDGTSVQRNSPVPVLEAGEAVQVSAGWYHTETVTTGPGPSPPLEVVAGTGSLTVKWRQAKVEAKPWTVAWRANVRPPVAWGKAAHPVAAARSFTITGLTAGQPYQVRVQDVNYGPRVIVGTPR